MFIYEITATVDDGLAVEYEKYMTERHIPDLLATGHFITASFAKAGNLYRVAYNAERRENVDAYLADDAERLRTDFAEHFPTGVAVSRQVFEIVRLFSSP